MGERRDLFPYDLPRRGQAEFLKDARKAVGQGSILLAQAPTGLGKTAVALTSTVECSLKSGKKVLFTTCRRSQHRIAVETLRRMVKAGPPKVVDIIAREAMCGDHLSHSSTRRSRVASVARALLRSVLHVQEFTDLAERFGVCAYETALKAASRADVLVCDYNYIFGPQRRHILRNLCIGLDDVILVVDEAHNLPSRSRQVLSSEMTVEGLEQMVVALGSRRAAQAVASVAQILRAESRVVGGESKVPRDFLDRLLSRCLPGARGRQPSRRLANILEKVKSDAAPLQPPLLGETVHLLKNWGKSGYLRLLSSRSGGSLSLLALDPRPATQDVFESVHACLLMSGTLHPGEMYVDILGIPGERSIVREYVPNFPPENRLLLASRELSSSYRLRPESYRAYAREIHAICRSIPGNVAVFFPSYDMARQVGEFLRRFGPNKRFLWERRGQSKAEKEGMLRELETARQDGGRLLMAVQGGSLSEGIDYPGNLLRGVVVAGLSLSPPHLEVEALRSFYSERFGRRKGYEYAYLNPALNRLVQCAGRCIRSAEDVAAVVILDGRILRPFILERLPSTFRPAVPRNIPGRVRRFFLRTRSSNVRCS